MTQVEELRGLLARCTPGKLTLSPEGTGAFVDKQSPYIFVTALKRPDEERQANAALLAFLWNNASALLDEIEAQDARIADLATDADALAEALDEISDMLMARPDMVRALQPLIGWAEKATMARAAGALQGHLACKSALALQSHGSQEAGGEGR